MKTHTIKYKMVLQEDAHGKLFIVERCLLEGSKCPCKTHSFDISDDDEESSGDVALLKDDGCFECGPSSFPVRYCPWCGIRIKTEEVSRVVRRRVTRKVPSTRTVTKWEEVPIEEG